MRGRRGAPAPPAPQDPARSTPPSVSSASAGRGNARNPSSWRGATRRRWTSIVCTATRERGATGASAATASSSRRRRSSDAARVGDRATRGGRKEQPRDRGSAIHRRTHRRVPHRRDLRSLRPNVSPSVIGTRRRAIRFRFLPPKGGSACVGSSPAASASSARTSFASHCASGPQVDIVNLDAMTYAGNPANLRDVEDPSRYRFVKGDVCDPAAVRAAIGDGVDAIVNFAAETHVDRSIPIPRVFFGPTRSGTLTLLEAARERRIATVPASVDRRSLRRRRSGASPSESDPLRPRSPYAASKAGADLHGARLPCDLRRARADHARQQHLRPESISGEDRPALRHELDRRPSRAAYTATACRFATGSSSKITRARSCTSSNTARPATSTTSPARRQKRNLELTGMLVAPMRPLDGHARQPRRRSSGTRPPLRSRRAKTARSRVEAAPAVRRGARPHRRLVPRQRNLVASAQGADSRGILT